jgi:hypothetical protein
LSILNDFADKTRSSLKLNRSLHIGGRDACVPDGRISCRQQAATDFARLAKKLTMPVLSIGERRPTAMRWESR